MLKILFYITLLVSACMCAVSCADTCNDNRNSLPLAGFYVSGADGTRQTVSNLAIIGASQRGDSVLSASDITKDQVYLPFCIDEDVTKYVFVKEREGGELVDTVTFVYTRTPKFTNAACGVCYVFGMREIKSQGVLIDSVVCPEGYIDNVNVENLRIYFNDDILDVQ